jgi:hypothetical protein
MTRSQYFIWLSITTAAGTALGILSDSKKKAQGALIGGTAALAAGSLAAGVYQYLSEKEKVPYYSASSPFYDDGSAY